MSGLQLVETTWNDLWIHMYKKVQEDLVCDVPCHLYDPKKRILLLQIPKNGSTYMVSKLSGMRNLDFPAIYRHEGVGSWIKKLGAEKWNLTDTWAIIRNPYDRLISYYAHQIQHEEIPMDWTFDQFLRKAIADDNPHIWQHRHICDKRGRILVKHVVKYEKGLDEIVKTFDNLGIDVFRGETDKTNMNMIDFDLSEVAGMLTPEVIALIRKEFYVEFKIFEYSDDPVDYMLELSKKK
tara:strand:- start:2226 stop:2936 length:711 start_codon:yes stop_codon:yes gene_type:complete